MRLRSFYRLSSQFISYRDKAKRFNFLAASTHSSIVATSAILTWPFNLSFLDVGSIGRGVIKHVDSILDMYAALVNYPQSINPEDMDQFITNNPDIRVE